MFAATHTETSPWYVVSGVPRIVPCRLDIFFSVQVESDDKKKARLNCISHLLTLIPYGDLPYTAVDIPERQKDDGYVRPPKVKHSKKFFCLLH